MGNTFEMVELGLLHLFLGLKVLQIYDGIFISQSKYGLIFYKSLEWKTINNVLHSISRG